MLRLFTEFIAFLRQEKKWWLIPLVAIVVIIGTLVLFSSNPVIAPLMYPFM